MIRLFALLFALLLPLAAQAHETTRSYVRLDRSGATIDLRLRVAFRDIEVAVWIDENLDGAITWGEVQARMPEITEYLMAGFALNAGGACTLSRTTADVSNSGGLAYLDLFFTGTCPDAKAPLTATSHLFTDIDLDHRMFLTATTDGSTTTTLLSRTNPTITLTGDSGGLFASFAVYFISGIQHLLGGPDHLAFLLVLMLPAICSGNTPRQAAIGIITAVTGFTIAHALTLTAAMTNLLRPPSGMIEAAIALTIIITAIDNIRPFIPAPRPAMAAAFGIVHGFGFATALGALDLDGMGFFTALVGFNLGIESAQVALVLVTMPLLYALGAGRLVMWTGSATAGAAGLWWLWTRTIGLMLAG